MSPILREENLPDSMSHTAFRAGLHLRLFDDLRAMLHVDAHLGALTLVHRMAHAKTAQCPLTLLCGSRNSGQWQRGKNHCENREFRSPHHRCSEKVTPAKSKHWLLHFVIFSSASPDNGGNKTTAYFSTFFVPAPHSKVRLKLPAIVIAESIIFKTVQW